MADGDSGPAEKGLYGLIPVQSSMHVGSDGVMAVNIENSALLGAESRSNR